MTDFVNHMVKLPDSTQHYTSDEILALGEHFVNEQGNLASDELLSHLMNVRMSRNLRKDIYSKGIHELVGF